MTIIYLGIAWLIGLLLASVSIIPTLTWLLAGLAAVVAALVFRRQARPRFWLVVLGVVCLGAARYAAAVPQTEQQFEPHQVAYYNGLDDILLTGSVIEEPEVGDRHLTLRLRAESITSPGNTNQPVDGLVLVTTARLPSIPYGVRLQLQGKLIAPPENPGFDYRSYLARQGIHSQMAWPKVTVLAEGGGSPLHRAIFALKDRARATIQHQLPDPQAALLTGILLGDETDLPPKLEEQFKITGLTHIIAISGFNIAILVGLLLAVGRPFLGRQRAAWFAMIGVALYTILVGAEPSVVRAAIMGGLFIVAFYLLGRPTFALAGLFTAAIAMTFVDPFILWNIGFQLSFAATLGLMLYVGPWSEWSRIQLERFLPQERANKATRLLADVVLVTLAAMLLTLPLIAYYFGRLSIVSPLANLLVLPAQPGVMIWGGLSTLTGLFIPALGQLFAWVAWLFLAYTVSLVRIFAALPGAAVPISLSSTAVIAIYVLIFGATWFAFQTPGRREQLGERLKVNLPQRTAFAGLAIVLVLLVLWLADQPDGKLHVAFLDVGQGDATFIQTPSGRQILVDGGAYPSILEDHLGRQMPFWDTQIDIVVATHADADHVAGLVDLFDRFEIGRLITNGLAAEEVTYNQLLAAAARSDGIVHHALAGEVIAIEDGVSLEILNPNGTLDITGDNDNSVAFRLTYEDFSLLMTGDAGQTAEKAMLASGRPLSAVVYKAGHHGANDSSSAPFLAAVQPQQVVISSGADNEFGHPHEEMLQRAHDVGAAVLRTDELGTIEVTTDGQEMTWQAKS